MRRAAQVFEQHVLVRLFRIRLGHLVFGAVLGSRTTRTLSAAVYNVLTLEQLSWGPLAAAAIVVTLPVLLLTMIIQKEIVAGLSTGGVKARCNATQPASTR